MTSFLFAGAISTFWHSIRLLLTHEGQTPSTLNLLPAGRDLQAWNIFRNSMNMLSHRFFELLVARTSYIENLEIFKYETSHHILCHTTHNTRQGSRSWLRMPFRSMGDHQWQTLNNNVVHIEYEQQYVASSVFPIWRVTRRFLVGGQGKEFENPWASWFSRKRFVDPANKLQTTIIYPHLF